MIDNIYAIGTQWKLPDGRLVEVVSRQDGGNVLVETKTGATALVPKDFLLPL